MLINASGLVSKCFKLRYSANSTLLASIRCIVNIDDYMNILYLTMVDVWLSPMHVKIECFICMTNSLPHKIKWKLFKNIKHSERFLHASISFCVREFSWYILRMSSCTDVPYKSNQCFTSNVACVTSHCPLFVIVWKCKIMDCSTAYLCSRMILDNLLSIVLYSVEVLMSHVM